MLWKIYFPANCETSGFAAAELKRYLERMDGKAEILLMRTDGYRADFADSLFVGTDAAFTDKLPEVGDVVFDDGIFIDVNSTGGVITGVNARSVLLAAYRFLTELGCAWVRPGLDGEIIPRRETGKDKVRVCEIPSYRHRGLCIEGAVSYDHVMNTLDWLPKVGMNGYFNQFMIPFAFFDRWYTHKGNPLLEPHELSMSEIGSMVRQHIAEIKKRGMLYHAAGHGWTCEPFGIEGSSWEKLDYHVPEESIDFLALVNGKRELSDGLPLNTNLCYSNPAVREKMLGAITDYCTEHKDVDYLHFWLADGLNNHCECESCKDIRPSDFYVSYLNDLDKRLAAINSNTKIVFLIYVDLLWEPVKERLANPSRFVLMFAPITRTYSSSYSDNGESGEAVLSDYVRNKLEMPRNVAENVARLGKWQERFDGDGFIFDYHYMWDHFRDPGGMQIAKVLFDDMKNLAELGLNGMLSCQVQRAFYPTGLGMNMMARALWDKNADFETEVKSYLKIAYGERWRELKVYLERISKDFDPAYIRHEKPQQDAEAAARFEALPKQIAGFKPVIDAALNDSGLSVEAKASWRVLSLHADYCVMLAEALACKARGEIEIVPQKWEKIERWAQEHEMELSDVLDVYYFLLTMKTSVIEEDIRLF